MKVIEFESQDPTGTCQSRITADTASARHRLSPIAYRLATRLPGDSPGSCTGLREFFEGRGQGYVLRVPSNFHLTLAGQAKVTCAEVTHAAPHHQAQPNTPYHA